MLASQCPQLEGLAPSGDPGPLEAPVVELLAANGSGWGRLRIDSHRGASTDLAWFQRDTIKNTDHVGAALRFSCKANQANNRDTNDFGFG